MVSARSMGGVSLRAVLVLEMGRISTEKSGKVNAGDARTARPPAWNPDGRRCTAQNRRG